MSSTEIESHELTKLLEDLKAEIIKKNPSNLIKFAYNYFRELHEKDILTEDLPAEDSYDENEEDRFSSDCDSFDRDVMTEKMSKMKLIQSSNIPRKSIVCEPFDPSSIDNETFEKNRRIFPKTQKQLDKISDILKTIFLFNCLEEEQVDKVIESMFLVEVLKGDVIIKENDSADNLYVIDNGTFVASNQNNIICTYVNEGYFGELALLYNCPRAATVTAKTDGGLWAIDRITFRQLILKSAYQKRERFLEFIKSVPILKELSKYDQYNLADALKSKIVNNEKIITQGETGDKMYFIEEGEVLVTSKSGDDFEKEQNRLTVGDYFGEVALLAKIPRIANVYAIGMTKLAELDVKTYNRLMGPCIDRMRDNFSKYRSQLESILSKDQMKELFPNLVKA